MSAVSDGKEAYFLHWPSWNRYRTVCLTGGGKSTVIKKLYSNLTTSNIECNGFYTEEIREGKFRKGFKIYTFKTENSSILAHVDFTSPLRVGKYGVDIKTFENTVLPELQNTKDTKIILIDEVGKMECFSSAFTTKVSQLLDQKERLVIGTVAEKAGGFPSAIRNRTDLLHLTVSHQSRDQLPNVLFQHVQEFLGKK